MDMCARKVEVSCCYDKRGGNQNTLISIITTNDIICILFQPIKEDASKFDRIKDVDEDPGTSTLFNTIIESFI